MSAEREPNKQKYSYQEMVERLRETRPPSSRIRSEEREVDPETGKVTVRREKRRRTGKTKSGVINDPRWFRFFRRLTYFGIPLLVILLIVTYLVVAASTGTGRFQEGVARVLARDLGLESVALKDTKLRAFSLHVGQATLQGKQGSMIAGAEMQQVEMRLSPRSFLGGSWTVEGCEIGNLKLALAAPAPVATSGVARPSPALAGFLLADEPTRIHFSDVTVTQADILFGKPANATPAARDALPGLRKVRGNLLLRPGEQEGDPEFFRMQGGGGRDGSLTLPGWPVFRVETLNFNFHEDHAIVRNSVLRFAQSSSEARAPNATDGFVEVKGTIPYAPGATAELHLALRDVALTDLISKNITRYLNGVLHTEGLRLTWLTSDPSSTWAIEGPINLRRGQIRKLGILEGLSDLTAGELAGLDFDEFTAVLNMTPELTRISEIRGRGIGRAHVNGEIKVEANGKLDGQLQLGIAIDSMAENSPSFFRPGEESSFWTPVTLSGNTTNPKEDLSARIEAWANEQSRVSPRLPREDEEAPGFPIAPGDPSSPASPAPEIKDEKQLESLFQELLKDE